MKKIITLLIIAFILIIWAILRFVMPPEGIGTYSQGLRVGQLTKFSVKGIINNSGEGQLLMGYEGTPYVIKDSEGEVKKVVNPWYFSAGEKFYKKMKEYYGKYVVIEYRQSRIRNPLFRDTDYNVTAVYPVSNKYLPKKDSIWVEGSGSKSEGFRTGRFVKLSFKGMIGKSFESILQQGNSGNQFKHMSIANKKIYDYAVRVAKTMRKVRIDYKESVLYNPLIHETGHEIIGIKIKN